MVKFTVRRFGKKLAIVLPDDLTRRLSVREGTSVLVIQEGTASYRLIVEDQGLRKQLKAAEDIIRRYRRTLRMLAG